MSASEFEKEQALQRPPVRRFLFPSVPLRPDTLCLAALASRLCARPARTARSGGRGTLGRNLPGPVTSSVTRRKRRPFPAFERLRKRSRQEGRGGLCGRWKWCWPNLAYTFFCASDISGLVGSGEKTHPRLNEDYIESTAGLWFADGLPYRPDLGNRGFATVPPWLKDTGRQMRTR